MQIKRKGAKSKGPKPKWYRSLATNRLFILLFAWTAVIVTYCSMPPVPSIPGAPSHPLEGYNSNFELHARAFRFPSVNDRVKMYMSNWYLPPCKVGDGVHFKITSSEEDEELLRIREVPVVGGEVQRTFQIESKTIVGGFPFMMNRDNLHACDGPVSIYEFCNDTKKSVVPSLDRVVGNSVDDLPLILQFGDAQTTEAKVVAPSGDIDKMYPQIPFFRKFRHAMSKTDLKALTRGRCQAGKRKIAGNRRAIHRLQPIIWLLTEHRHFGPIEETRLLDTPWEHKRDRAIWRGGLTGVKAGGFYTHQELEEMADYERCQAIARCKLVFNHANSSLVDAKLVGGNKLRGWLPESGEVEGVQLYADEIPYDYQLRYKAIIMIEGNDISSGFKWALMSSSVVMVPPFVYSSWAMEELLVPWVHYIPLLEDLSDVEEKFQWVLDNDKKAKEIGRRGQLWMMDLMYHPNADSDNKAIFDEMMRRYRTHFVHAPDV